MNEYIGSSVSPVIAVRPLVTIVTVVRNACGTIQDTINSVLAQTCPRIEYWVIDGNSNDGTVDVLRSYGLRLLNWISERDQGIADAFNKGLERAAGEYIMFLNADDALADPNVVDRMIASAAAHGYPDVLYGDCDLHNVDTGQKLYSAHIPYDRRRLLRGHMLPHPGMFIHRRYFERFGQFDTSFQIGMDYELLIRGVPEIGATHVPLLVTRVRTGGLSTRDRRLVVDEVIRALSKNNRFQFWFEPFLLRSRYAVRYSLRRIAEVLGLYGFWLKRQRRKCSSAGINNEGYGARDSA